MSNNTSVVETENLTKIFQNKEVIKNCNINVKEGIIYGILGENGAGKTTLLKLISALLVPTVGKIKVFGKDVVSERDKILSNIGTLIENPVFYDHLSAEENLKIHLLYMGLEYGNFNNVLSRVGLENTGDLPVSKFSLGMRQRLAIARAIVHKPKLLLLDEPINGLDPIGIREMRDLFLQLKNEDGITIVISSHILNEIEHIADTVAVISNGIVLEELSIDTIKEEFSNSLEDYFFNLIIRRKKSD